VLKAFNAAELVLSLKAQLVREFSFSNSKMSVVFKKAHSIPEVPKLWGLPPGGTVGPLGALVVYMRDTLLG
jgi:hypothetical protein